MFLNSQSAVLAQIRAHALAGNIWLQGFEIPLFNTSLPTTGAADSFVVDGDAAFVVYYINGDVFDPITTYIENPNIMINIQNAGSGQYLSRDPMSWVSTIGTAKNPFVIPEPIILPPSSNVAVSLTNQSGQAYDQVNMVWIGAKLKCRPGFTLDDLSAPVAIDFAYT